MFFYLADIGKQRPP